MHYEILEPSDRPQLLALFESLSPRSRHLRYLAPVRRLSSPSLRHLAAIDHVRHEAIGAFDGTELVGAAHYIRAVDDAGAAEISIEVSDAYQYQGIGTQLLSELGELARSRGISRFTACALTENPAVAPVIKGLGWPVTQRGNGPLIDLVLNLPRARSGEDDVCEPRWSEPPALSSQLA